MSTEREAHNPYYRSRKIRDQFIGTASDVCLSAAREAITQPVVHHPRPLCLPNYINHATDYGACPWCDLIRGTVDQQQWLLSSRSRKLAFQFPPPCSLGLPLHTFSLRPPSVSAISTFTLINHSFHATDYGVCPWNILARRGSSRGYK
jgi:hypothetical protein